MSKRKLSWLIGAALILLLLLQAPAAWLGHFINDQCASQCRLAQVSGPWWAGQGELFVKSPGNGHWKLLGDINWRLATPYRLEVGLGKGRAELELGLSRVKLTLDQMVLPAELLLSQKVFGLPTASWNGSLNFHGTQAVWTYWASKNAHGVVVWENMASSMIENYPLGSLELRWDWQEAQGLSGTVASLPNEVMSLRGKLESGPTFKSAKFAGLVDLSANARPRLEKYLRLVAQPVAGQDGRYSVQLPSDLENRAR